MKTFAKRLLCLGLSAVLALGLAACGGNGTTENDGTADNNDTTTVNDTVGTQKAELLSFDVRPDAPAEIPEGLDIDWNHRYTFAELESQLSEMAKNYPDITKLYSIGTTGRREISGVLR